MSEEDSLLSLVFLVGLLSLPRLLSKASGVIVFLLSSGSAASHTG